IKPAASTAADLMLMFMASPLRAIKTVTELREPVNVAPRVLAQWNWLRAHLHNRARPIERMSAMPTNHELFASPETVHWGYFDAKFAPVLSSEGGAAVALTSVWGGHNITPPAGNGMAVLPEHIDIPARHTAELGPHILTGPIYIAG